MDSEFTSDIDEFKNVFYNTERLLLKLNFLENCISRKVLPKGFQLRFNLAYKADDILLNNLQKVLDEASSKIVLLFREQIELDYEKSYEKLADVRKQLAEKVGEFYSERIVGETKKQCKDTFKKIKISHEKKIKKLIFDKNSHDDVCNFLGSLQLQSNNFRIRSTCDCDSETNKTKERPHRQLRRGKRKKRDKTKATRQEWVPSEEDLKCRDPIVLAENVTLTPDQISICRLSDKFIPTPTSPIDVCDQMIGTHQWAERLRWHRFHQIKDKKDQELNGDDQVDNEEEQFIKSPWYQPTDRPAPKGDHALEAFIEKCTNDFLEIEGRKRIKDNLTKGQRKALKELKDFPLTQNAACRYADKSGITVITSLDKDDANILNDLKNDKQYDTHHEDPTPLMKENVCKWVKKWESRGCLNPDIASYVKNIDNTRPAKCKPLIKTHKAKPYPHRLLLSGSNTPTQPLSKFVQLSISHLTSLLPYQIVDTKDFLKKLDVINTMNTPLPPKATLVTCDVVALYPSVDNSMGIPAVREMLNEHPSPLKIPTECVVEGLKISLDNNACYYTDGEGNTVFASPNNGTAMGPCHAPDYVDIFMGKLDKKLVESSPIPLLASVPGSNVEGDEMDHVSWSRYRDDGFIIIPNEDHVSDLERHLQSLCPGKICWTLNHGQEVEYLDVKVSITEGGKLKTDVFSKNSHSYLPPHSCHPPSVFKGLALSIGRRLRMICSEDSDLEIRIKEYAKYLATSGWSWNRAIRELRKGASKPRPDILKDKRKKSRNGTKKIAWVTTYDPRVPSKSNIIRKNINILHSSPLNKEIFPKNSLIAADRRRRNIGEIYKPTIPRRHVYHGPKEENGYFLCKKKCDTCKHSEESKSFRSLWDGRKWKIKDKLSCSTPNVIYLIECKLHPDFLYVGSTINLKKRWANHKSDCKNGKTQKCWVSNHVNNIKTHDTAGDLSFLKIIPIEHVSNEERLLEREIYWQANLGTFFTGGNVRKDFHKVSTRRIQFSVT